MKQMDDRQLLDEYARRNSEEAFRALVERYTDFVYHAALRQAGNPHVAEEVTQAVFIALAQKADRIPRGSVLSGWLFRAARFALGNLARGEARRQRREQQAVIMETILGPGGTESVWEQIAPDLNDALDKLSTKDREVLLIRFFQEKTHKETARSLGVSEDAAKVRVSRAVEKLRLIFAARGFVVAPAVLVAALSTHGAQAAPAGLAASVAAIAIAKGTAGTASTLTIAKGILKVMAWTKIKTAAVVGTVALLATVTTTVLVCKPSSSAQLKSNITRAKMGVPTDPNAIARAEANSKILIFRNVRSWNRNPDFEEALTSLQFKYDVKPSAEMENADLSAYDVVIVPGAQWNTSYYHDYAANAARFEGYVSNGGALVFELNGAEGTGITLPGGARMVPHGSLDNFLTIPEHPILLPLGGRPIHANYASHGYLNGVPNGATVLAVELVKSRPAMNRPTFIEYAFGSGRVIAACQCFHDQDGSRRGPLMNTVVEYAAVKQWFSAK